MNRSTRRRASAIHRNPTLRTLLLGLATVVTLLMLFLRLRTLGTPRFAGSTVDLAPVLLSPESTPSRVTFMVASDSEGSITPERRIVLLPPGASVRARALLNDLLAGYSMPGSLHPIAPSPGVDTVFFVPLPATSSAPGAQTQPKGALAVVNLSGAFASVHPSGIEPETMTLLSIISTLHINIPEVAEVRFLVAGRPQATLAGHADLTHTYLASSSAAPIPDMDGTETAPAGSPGGEAHP